MTRESTLAEGLANAWTTASEQGQLPLEERELRFFLAALSSRRLSSGRCLALDGDELLEHDLEEIRRARLSALGLLLWAVREDHDAPDEVHYILARSVKDCLVKQIVTDLIHTQHPCQRGASISISMWQFGAQ